MNKDLILLDPEDEHYRDKVFYTGHGYLAFWLDGKNIFLHKHLLGITDERQVDHKDNNKWNCQKDNLRVATRSQNSQNREKFLGSYSSQYKGVMYRKDRQCFIAGIRVNKKYIHLGSGTETYCAELYNQAALTYFGEFAKLNEISYG